MHRLGVASALAAVLAGCGDGADESTDPQALRSVQLTPGFQPEGSASGPEGKLYVGTLTRGGILEVDIKSGKVHFLVEPPPVGERVIAGLTYDGAHQKIYACGAWNSNGFVFDAVTGERLAQIDFPEDSFLNDVRVRGAEAYFTDSRRQVFYRLSLSQDGLPTGVPVEVPLSGDFETTPGLEELNSNGIVAIPNSKDLLIANTSKGSVFRVDSETGVATRVDVDVPNPDGLILDGDQLYVVENHPRNAVSVLKLSADHLHASVERVIEDPRMDSPSTGVKVGSRLWVVNSRLADIFHGATAPDDQFELIALDLGERVQ